MQKQLRPGLYSECDIGMLTTTSLWGEQRIALKKHKQKLELYNLTFN